VIDLGVGDTETTRFELLTGIDTPSLIRLLGQNRFRVERAHLRSLRHIAAISLPATAFGALDSLFYGSKIAATPVFPPPLFILGHWRSGTTWLQKLLSLDPRCACPTFFQCTFPQAFLSGERFLKPRTAEDIPPHRPFDNVPLGVDEPFEEEFALARTALVSPMLGFVFPQAWWRYDSHCEPERWRRQEQQRWQQGFLRFARKLTLVSSGRRLVFKSPAHGYRLNLLLEIFPAAKFLLIVRNPYEVFASTRHLLRSLLHHNRLHAGGPVDLDEIVFDRYLRMYIKLENDLPLLAQQSLTRVRFEDLERRPLQELERAYGELGLDDFAPAREPIKCYLRRSADYEKNVYDLTPAEKERIVNRWRPAFESYGYAL
jgi:hypothetical protein